MRETIAWALTTFMLICVEDWGVNEEMDYLPLQ